MDGNRVAPFGFIASELRVEEAHRDRRDFLHVFAQGTDRDGEDFALELDLSGEGFAGYFKIAHHRRDLIQPWGTNAFERGLAVDDEGEGDRIADGGLGRLGGGVD